MQRRQFVLLSDLNTRDKNGLFGYLVGKEGERFHVMTKIDGVDKILKIKEANLGYGICTAPCFPQVRNMTNYPEPPPAFVTLSNQIENHDYCLHHFTQLKQQIETVMKANPITKSSSSSLKNSYGLILLSQLYLHHEMWEQCVITAEEYLKFDSNSSFMISNFVSAYACLPHGNNPTGLLKQSEYLTRAIQLDPQSFFVGFNLAGVYTDLGQYDKAIECYELYLPLYPCALVFSKLASCYHAIGDHHNAVRISLRAVSLTEPLIRNNQTIFHPSPADSSRSYSTISTYLLESHIDSHSLTLNFDYIDSAIRALLCCLTEDIPKPPPHFGLYALSTLGRILIEMFQRKVTMSSPESLRGYIQGAIQCHEYCLEIKPTDTISMNYLAEAYCQLVHIPPLPSYEHTVSILQHAITLYRRGDTCSGLSSIISLGRIFLQLGDLSLLHERHEEQRDFYQQGLENMESISLLGVLPLAEYGNQINQLRETFKERLA
jgi:tetratricopeptide (TPR) repeat protein